MMRPRTPEWVYEVFGPYPLEALRHPVIGFRLLMFRLTGNDRWLDY